MADYYIDLNGNLTKKQKKKKKADYTVSLDGKITQVEDIAPVTTTKSKERSWFESGAFSDGYQFGDVTKTILGSGTDLLENVGTGIISMGEKAVDTMAYLAPAFSMGQKVQNGAMLTQADLDLHREMQKTSQEFIKKDLYDEEKVAKAIISNPVKKVTGIDAETMSVFGEKSDALAQSGGQLLATLGLNAVGLPWWLTTGSTSFGGEVESAFKEGATYGEAGGSGLITAGAEILTEKLSGGIKFGGKTLDDVWLKPLTEQITDKTARTLTKLGFNAVGEGGEEVLTEIISNLGTSLYKEENISELLTSEEALDSYIESFIGGAVLGGGISGIDAIRTNKSGKDYVTGLTENETKVVDKEIENRVAEREADGTKLTRKEKYEIREQVMNDLDKGYINLDTIESVLGGETYETYKSSIDKEKSLREEMAKLEGNPSANAQNKLSELKAELSELVKNSANTKLKDQLSLEVQELTKSERLSESYNEKARRTQKFEADLTKYDAKTQGVIKKATESGILNNTNRTHEFVDMVAKLSADKGVSFDFTNNENLKKSGFAIEGKTINGLVKDNDIILNIDSSKALNTVVGHEITHVLEGTELYTELQNVVKEYATTKGEYETRYKAIQDLYKGVEGANIDNELTADLVGEYLFTDSDFINNLSTTKPTVFEKIYNEIKYLYKVATAGSKEARELEKVKRAFDKAYKESSKADSTTKYSMSDTKGRTVTEEQAEYFKDSAVRDENGNLKVMYHGTSAGGHTVFDPYGKAKYGLFGTGTYFTDDPSVAESYTEKGRGNNKQVYETYLNIKNPIDMDGQGDYEAWKKALPDAHFPKEGTNEDYYRAMEEYFEDNEYSKAEASEVAMEVIENMGYDGITHVGGGRFNKADETRHRVYIAFSSEQIKNVDNTKPTTDADIRYSLSEDSEGHTLSKEQKEYFKDSKVVNDNGELVVVYHGTRKADFTVFKRNQIFFTDNVEMADSYAPTSEKFAGYLNLKNPFVIDAQGEKWSGIPVDAELKALLENAGSSVFKEKGKWRTSTADITSAIEEGVDEGIFDYDGVIIKNVEDTGSYYKGKDNVIGNDYIAFSSSQFKSLDNKTPTDNPDINLSLGDQVAPVGNYNVYGKDIALETAPVQETVQEVADEYAPITDASMIDAQQNDRLYSLNESEMPDEAEAPFYEPEDITVESPFDERDIKDVGKRNVNAYMYDNPEVKPYFQQEAQNMLWELENSTKGERVVNAQVLYDTNGESGVYGVKRHTSKDIEYLLDNFNGQYSYDDIRKGLNAIIEDHGAENNALSKRIEFLLDERLREGYTDFMYGETIPPNQDYINLLMDKQINTYSDEAYNQYLESLASEYSQEFAPTRQYEAIEPAPTLDAQEQEWANNKMTRVKDPNKVTSHKVDVKQRRWVDTSTESEVVNREILPDDLDLSKIVYEPIPNKVTLGNANSKLSTLGYDEALTYFNSQLAGKKATLDDIALGERLLQEAMKKGDKVTAGELIQNISILGTELGQKVQALSIIQRLTPEGQLKMLYKTVKRGKVKGDKAFEGVELTQEMIDHILKTYKADGTFDQNELNKAVEDVKKDIAKNMKVTTIDKVNAWRYLAMLGNPKTHIRNLVSNVAMKGTVGVKNVVARTIESVAPIKERTKTFKIASKEVKEFAEKTTLEMKDVISEDTKYSEEASIKSKRDMFKNKILNKVYEFNNELMEKEDWWFSKSAYKNSLSEYLTANGIKTTKDIEKNPQIVEKAKQYALEQSQIATFRQYSWLANKIREVERKNTATEIAVGSILPFKKTPVNIAKAGLSYSPIGLFVKLPYDLVQMKQGKKQASEVIDSFAQGTTGTALTLAGYMLAMSGLLSGGGDDDKEGKYDYQLGEQAYSINFGGNSYSLSWLSPVAMPLFVGANAYEQLVEGEEWNGNVVMETLAQTLDPLSEMSFLSSLDSVLSSYDSGVEKFAGIGKSMIQNYVTQFIPTLSSQLATVMDDKKRSTKVAGDSEFELVDETINKLIYKIPFLRETLEPTTDIWGNEVKQSEDMIERALETFIAPYSRKESIATEIDAEIKDLYAQTGDNGIIPNIPYNYVNYDGEKYNMSAKEYTEFKKTYGQTANEMLEDLFNTTTYQNATSEDRAELVNKVYDYARDEAKREYLGKEGVEYTNATQDGMEYYKENSIKGAIENDMTLDEFDMFAKTPEKYYVAKAVGGYDAYKSVSSVFSTLEADKDENGNSINGSRKKKIIEYINTTNLDYGAKLVMFKSVYNADDTYNNEIIEYLNSRTDITYEEEVAILKELGFTVDPDGTIRW